MLAIIGGTGLSILADLEITRREIVRTPYGEASGPLTFGRIGNSQVCFLARHGYGHTIAPHEVNYRANIWAIKEGGVKRVIAINAVGGISAAMGPGVIAVPDQIVDYTWGRKHTFFEGPSAPVRHVDFTQPYCTRTRALIIEAAKMASVPALAEGTYAATQGPRLETAGEIDRLERDGAHMVGMTGMPEAALARELELPYAAIALSVNHAAGRGASSLGIRLEDIKIVLSGGMDKVKRVLKQAVELNATPPWQ